MLVAISNGRCVQVDLSKPQSREELAGKHSLADVFCEKQACVVAMCQVSQPIAVPSVADDLQNGEVCDGHACGVVSFCVWRMLDKLWKIQAKNAASVPVCWGRCEVGRGKT